MLIASIKANFNQIITLLNQLDSETYSKCHLELSNATIGEHVRHIIEMYQSLLSSYSNGVVNYDKRERNILIQTNIQEAINAITFIVSTIALENKKIIVEQGISATTFSVDSNYYRELLYNLEHSIHHQALIKVALLKLNAIQIPNDFGVAKSTIEYRSQCAQ